MILFTIHEKLGCLKRNYKNTGLKDLLILLFRRLLAA